MKADMSVMIKIFEFSSWNDVPVQTGLYIGFSFRFLFHALIEI